MKLFYSPSSPFVRKVRVMAIESGIDGQIELIEAPTMPTKTDAGVAASNPLGKIPCLVTNDGKALYDSRVICEFLDSQVGNGDMFPQGGERWDALRRQALGDGIMDAGVLARYETFLRPEDKRWDDWLQGQMAKVMRSLDLLAAEAGSLSGRIDIGSIAIGCALGYLDFRYGNLGWRNGRKELAAWFDEFNARPSMQQTMPQ